MGERQIRQPYDELLAINSHRRRESKKRFRSKVKHQLTKNGAESAPPPRLASACGLGGLAQTS